MPSNPSPTILEKIWPPARRRAREAQAAREAEDLRRVAEAEKAARRQREAEALRIQSYETHIRTFDLNGIGTHHGAPLAGSELLDAVKRRLDLAAELKRDDQITLADDLSDAELAEITGELDQTALEWLHHHKDPERQRDAAMKILDARADLPHRVSLDDYATAVAETAVRSSDLTFRRHRRATAVMIRAILLRSADPRWQAQRRGAKRPLSAVPYSLR